MNNTDLFLNKYKELEAAVKLKYGLSRGESVVTFLKRKAPYSTYSAEIQCCAELRNLLAHNPKIGGEHITEPSAKTLEFLDFLINKVKNRPRSKDIAVKYQDIYKETLSGNVKNTMAIMKSKRFSHVPIVENHRVVGVFDKNSIFLYLTKEGVECINNLSSLTFADIEQYVSLKYRTDLDFIFARSNMFVDELEDIFEKALDNGKRISLVFLTATGSKGEPLQGIVTPWDIIGAE